MQHLQTLLFFLITLSLCMEPYLIVLSHLQNRPHVSINMQVFWRTADEFSELLYWRVSPECISTSAWQCGLFWLWQWRPIPALERTNFLHFYIWWYHIWQSNVPSIFSCAGHTHRLPEHTEDHFHFLHVQSMFVVQLSYCLHNILSSDKGLHLWTLLHCCDRLSCH